VTLLNFFTVQHTFFKIKLSRGEHRSYPQANWEVQAMKTLDIVAAVLVIVGALNWGLVGLFHFDLVAAIFGMSFGQTSPLSSIVYVLVGLAALYQALTLKSVGRRWSDSSPARA
jgi:uncharacterized membrane protein YuzA (DUF378 family)